MTWFKVDDSFYDHPKAEELSDSAVALWTRAGSYCAKHLTDGFISQRKANRMCDNPEAATSELVTAGLWDKEADGYRFHDWHEYQPTREEALATSKAKSIGGAVGNHRRWHVERGTVDPRCPYCQTDSRSTTDPSTDPSTDRITDPSTDRITDRTTDRPTESLPNPPSRPDPTRPEPVLPTEEPTTKTLPPAAGSASPEPARTTAKKATAKRATPPAEGSGELTVNQRAKAITDAYCAEEPLSQFLAVRAIVAKAIGAERYSDDQIRDALLRMAKDKRSVTVNTLRTELDGPPPSRYPTTGNARQPWRADPSRSREERFARPTKN